MYQLTLCVRADLKSSRKYKKSPRSPMFAKYRVIQDHSLISLVPEPATLVKGNIVTVLDKDLDGN